MKNFQHRILLICSIFIITITTIVKAQGTAGYGVSPILVVNKEEASGLNALVPPQPPRSSIALTGASFTPSDLSSSSDNGAYNRDIANKHRAFRVSADQDFQSQCRDRINRKRRWHESTPDLEIGFNFTKYTVDRAHSILRDIENKQEITKGRYALGESFFWYYDPNRYRTVDDAVDTWYGEYRNYDYNRPGFSAKTGGFTQLVWKSSREVSCAKIDYETRNHYKTLLVCNYYPAGNVQAEFPYNVLPVRRSGGGHRPDNGDDYPNRPNRPDRPSRPENDRPNRPSRPDYDPRPPPNRPDNNDRPSRPENGRPIRPENDRPNRPERPDYDPRPPPNRPERPDYDPRPPSRPDRPRPPYDEDRPDRPNRPGGGGSGGGSGSHGGGNYPTHPVLVTGSQALTGPGEKVLKPLNPLESPLASSSVVVVPDGGSMQGAPTPVQYAPSVIAPQMVNNNNGQQQPVQYEPVEAVLILPQQVGGGFPVTANSG